MKKKILTLLLVTALGVTVLTGCSSNIETLPNKEQSNAVESDKNTNVTTEETIEVIHNAVVEAYGDNYLAETSLSKEELNEKFGLSEDMYKDAVADIPAMSVHVDTFVAVEAKEGKANEVFETLQKYRKTLVEDTFMYPMNVMKVQASKVYQYGNYVFFTMLGEIDDSLEEDSEALAYYESQNDIAKKVIEDILDTK